MPDKDAAQTMPDERPGSVNLRPSLQQLYDLYRTSLLNVKYYGYKLTVANRCNTTAEIVVVVGSAASGVSGWAIWTWGYGQHVWLVIAAIATLLAALKPVLQINKKIELYGKLFGGHARTILLCRPWSSVFRRSELSRPVCRQSIAPFMVAMSIWPAMMNPTRRDG